MFKQQINNPTFRRGISPGLLVGLFFCLLFSSFASHAKQWQVSPGNGTLQTAIDAAQAGDTLLLASGIYIGSVNIHQSLTLIGNVANSSGIKGNSSIIDGEGSSNVITISAPDVTIKGVIIRNSGQTLEDEDSGIYITDKGDGAHIEASFFENNLTGIFIKGAESISVVGNEIIGSQFHRMNDRGNGIYIWNTTGTLIKNNTIRYGRDGIYVKVSRHTRFIGNHLSTLRFAIHYMYTQDSEVSFNTSVNNHVGFALMFSDRIKATNNLSMGDSQRGLFFNFANYSIITNNRVTGGTEKCLFIYNANFNLFKNNSIEECDIGIHFTAGSENNEIYNNAFINNRTQVKYVGTRYIEWSKDGRGNFWSDNVAFDIDGNGIADQAYQPNDLVDQIIWRHPLAKLLLNSPAVQVLKWAQGEFPGIHPGGVTDSAPLMQPPPSLKTDSIVIQSTKMSQRTG